MRMMPQLRIHNRPARRGGPAVHQSAGTLGNILVGAVQGPSILPAAPDDTLDGALGLTQGQAQQAPAPFEAPMPSDRAAVPPEMSRGHLLAGIVADMLAGAAGRPGMFAQQMAQQRQQEREEVQWHRQRRATLDDFRERQRIEQEYPAPSPMLRDTQAYMGMSPEQRTAWGEMQEGRRGDPDVFVTLPNGQVYAGPRSGLTQALTGGAVTSPAAPVGRLTPLEGGAGPAAAPGGFQPNEFIDPRLGGGW